jgi:uncharacterized transporter YbjL
LSSKRTALTAGVADITLDPDTVNVLSAVIRDTSQGQQTDITIDRISREEYLNIPDKTTQRTASTVLRATGKYLSGVSCIRLPTRPTHLCTTGYGAFKMRAITPTQQT